MADLTNTLPEPTFSPQPIGGAKQSTLFEGLGNAGASILGAIDSAQRSAKSGAGTENNPVLDEEAMRIFEAKSGFKLGDPGYDNILKLKKLEAAKANGSMSTALYDIRVQGEIADLIRKNPNNAREIMADAYEKHGIKDELFREAAIAEEQDKADRTGQNARRQAILTEGLQSGYPVDPNDEQALYEAGVKSFMAKGQLAAKKAELDMAEADAVAAKRVFDPRAEEIRSQIASTFLDRTNDVVMAGFNRLSNLMASATDDNGREEIMQNFVSEGLLGLDQLALNAYATMDSYTKTVDINGVKATIGFTQKQKDDFKARIDNYKEMFRGLQTMKPDARKRALDMLTSKGQVSAAKQFPAIMQFSQVMGINVGAAMELLSSPDQFGLDPAVAAALHKKSAEGIDTWMNTSLKGIDDMINAGASPVASADVNVSKEAFVQSYLISNATGAQLRTGAFKTGEDQKAAVTGFDKYFEQALFGLARNYNEANVGSAEAETAVNMIFNDKTLETLDAFKKFGGDPEALDLFNKQLPIVGSTFLEGMKRSAGDRMGYNEQTKKFFAKPSKDFYIHPSLDPQWDINNKVAAANKILDFLDKANTRNPIMDPTLVKEAGVSVRDVLATSKGFDGAIKALAARARQANDESSNTYFQKAITGLTDPSKDMMGGIDVNPYDDSPSYSAPAGQFNLTAKAPEELQPAIDAAAKKYNVDPALLTAMFKQESGFRADARGPSIEKFKGTPDEFALGIAQLLPSTAKEMGVGDPLDVNQGIEGGAKYLGQQMEKFKDPVVALMAYNWGPSSVERWLKAGGDVNRIPAQTLDYVQRILGVDLKGKQ